MSKHLTSDVGFENAQRGSLRFALSLKLCQQYLSPFITTASSERNNVQCPVQTTITTVVELHPTVLATASLDRGSTTITGKLPFIRLVIQTHPVLGLALFDRLLDKVVSGFA